jgi:hypothetical protein
LLKCRRYDRSLAAAPAREATEITSQSRIVLGQVPALASFIEGQEVIRVINKLAIVDDQQGPNVAITVRGSLAGSGIGRNCERVHFIEELLALAEEEPIGSEACDRRHGATESIA